MTRIRLIKLLVLAAALLPAAALAYNAYAGNLTANPIEYLENETGDWAIILLMASLAVTPLRRVSGWNQVIRLRRLLGLLAFFYATMHVIIWITLVSFFDVPTMLEDIAKRPFITVGMATFLILLALAITSTQGWIRRLGKKWVQLHRLVYVAGVGAVVHFWWLVKADTTRPLRWAITLTVLFLIRIWWASRTRMPLRS